MNIQPSPLQQAILDAVRISSDNLLVQAAAGSGKTATLEMICRVLPSHLHTIALCFNRQIAEEFKRRLPLHVEARTLHSLGFKIIRDTLGREAEVDSDKPARILRHHLELCGCTGDWRRELRRTLPRLVSLCLATLTDPRNEEALVDLAQSHGLDLPEEAGLHIAELMEHSRKEIYRVSFDDMVDHPISGQYRFPAYDVVLVDEAQDLNLQQLLFIGRLLGVDIKSGEDYCGAYDGRLIAVGDRHQAIYGFRGADRHAMARIRKTFHCKELPLSVSYRCGTSIISCAQDVVGADEIQAAPGAPPGHTEWRAPEALGDTIRGLEDGDMVLCRVNAPLVSPCFELIRDQRKAIIRGRDIGVGLQNLVDSLKSRYGCQSVTDLLAALDRWAQRQATRLLARDAVTAAQAVEDRARTLYSLAEHVGSIDELKDLIRRVFDDSTSGVLFSSIHRAKGLESNTVVILAPELIPHPMALYRGSEDDLIQEQNLSYVARTRARTLLIFQPLGDTNGASAERWMSEEERAANRERNAAPAGPV